MQKDIARIVVHPLSPVFSSQSQTLILGTMPSPKSREMGFYYAHPQNRFWRTLATVYGEPVPNDNDARTALILRHDLALWDVLQSCRIVGASDASIQDPVANDIAGLILKTRITRVLATGKTAARLYERLVLPATDLPCVCLPSPSAANAATSLETLVRRYGEALLPERNRQINIE